jgi:hypothetical protein
VPRRVPLRAPLVRPQQDLKTPEARRSRVSAPEMHFLLPVCFLSVT